jgi:RecB family exonuclease
MLSLLPIAGSLEQRLRLQSFDPSVATWVVSDIKTKLDLNRTLLTERSFIPGDSVLRASELWRTMLTRIRPDLQCVSREFALALIAERLEAKGSGEGAADFEWVQAPGAAQVAYDYLSQLMPILAHPGGKELMTEWFAENQASQVRWGRWYELAHELWRGFLDEGFIAPPWIVGVLVNETELHRVWDRPLVIDLGAELNQVEADILAQLSNYVDVEILKPEPSWREEYAKTLAAYEVFETKIKARRLPPLSPRDESVKAKVRFAKFTTMIAEVKDATAQVRAWLDETALPIAPSDIAIVAPDIEAYWSALSSYLEHEGIPCQKPIVRRLHGYPDIARWMASLRLRAGAAAEADVELGLFDSLGRTPRLMTYERFKTLYTNIYGREDLARSEEVAARFAIELNAADTVMRDDFVAWSLKQLPEGADYPRVESLYRRLFAECPQVTCFRLRRWLQYFEQLAAKVECRLRDGEPDGISCINLSSAETSPAAAMIVLGLTESALRKNGGTAVLFSDIASLTARFGFRLASEDQAKLEFEARWVTENSGRALVLSVPETDFAGAVQAPSWLWVRGAREQGVHKELSLPRETRWDLIQKANQTANLRAAALERAWSSTHTEYLERSLREDMGLTPLENFGRDLVKSLSPSKIETYLDCPFVFAAKYLFGLSDVADLDLEVDPSRRGSLMHKIFEMLTREPFKTEYAEGELEAVVDEAQSASDMELADPRLWPPLKARYVDLARRFVQFEKEYRAKFPELKTVAREFDVAGHMRISTGELIRDAEPGSLRFSGRIDRVDSDASGHLEILDYKSSKNGLYQFGSWIKNNQIQLLLYAMAVEKGLTAWTPKPVLAALYYSSRPLNRETGFKVEGVEQGLYEIAGRAQNKISPEGKEALFHETEGLVKNAVARMLEGDFKPNPRDEKDCATCEWSGQCRAPHLNS